MRKHLLFNLIITSFLLATGMLAAQVGIGTTSPKGALDIESSTYGVVYPSVALTATDVAAPVVNPQGGALAIGTTVYNTGTTYSGAKDVEPGIYAWDGNKWVIHFFKRQSELFEQTTALRTSSNPISPLDGYEDVPGLGPSDGNSITAKYSGLYKIEIKVNYGGGSMIDNGDVNTAMAQGDFRFIFDGTTHIMNVKSFSTYNFHVDTGTYYDNIWVETYKTIYLNLVAGQTYDLSLEFNQADGPGFEANGDTSMLGDDGRGYVGEGIPCFVEITYIDE